MGQNGKNPVIEQKGLVREAIRLYANGVTMEQIGKKFGVSTASVCKFFKNHRNANERVMRISNKAQEKVLENDLATINEFRDLYTEQLRKQCKRLETELYEAYAHRNTKMIMFFESLIERLHTDVKNYLELHKKFEEGVIVRHEISGNLNIVNEILNCEPSYNAAKD
jgi:predicted transcriptional regulator